MADWNLRANDLFARAVEIDEPDQRRAFLETECGGDAALFSLVQSMLAAQEANGSFLEAPAVTIDRPIAEHPGSIIGPYKLLQQIGEGGFGVVFMADQERPVRRTVALKIIKAGMDTREVIARFEAERQALAMMDHLNIAKVLDAGATESGRPYFVMELVKGIPITEFCDRNHLPSEQRLKLFIDVCHAIQHAHHKGVIHRDVKPTNVMVTLHDGVPVVKVIDFGVAKATAQKLTERTLFTAFGQMVGTPTYMSPEQAEMSGLDIDTRSDIYSLGVLLYELLTGTTPLEAKRLRQAGLAEMQRLIREEDPPRPSTRLSSLGQAATALAGNRGTDPKQLAKLLAGDLDWIVMKALDKDRNRRYGTPGNLAEDIERCLRHEAILARPPSLAYKLKKFAQRNRTSVLASAAVAAALLLALTVVAGNMGWTMRDREARRARLASQLEVILKEVDQLEVEQKWPEALAAARRAETLLAGGEPDAAIRGKVEQVLADLKLVQRLDEVRMDQGALFDGRLESADRAYAAAFQEAGVDVDRMPADDAARRLGSRANLAPALIVSLDEWGLARYLSDKIDGAHKLADVARRLDSNPWRRQMRDALAEMDPQAPPVANYNAVETLERLATSPDLAAQPPAALYQLGMVLREALDKREQGIAVLRKAQAQYPGDFWINSGLAWCLRQQDAAQEDEALSFYRAALAVRPDSGWVWFRIGRICESRYKRQDEAISYYQKGVQLSPKNGFIHNALGSGLKAQNRLEEAKVCHQQAIKCFQEAIQQGTKDPFIHYYAGVGLQDQGKLDEAIAYYQEAVKLFPDAAQFQSKLGSALRAKKNLPDAFALFQKAIERNPKDTGNYYQLGMTLLDQHSATGDRQKVDEAIAVFKQGIEIDTNNLGCYWGLGRALTSQNKPQEAIACFQKCLELSPRHAESYWGLGFALLNQKKSQEALSYFRKSVDLNPNHSYGQYGLGLGLKAEQLTDEAVAAFRRSVQLDPNRIAAHFQLGILLAGKAKVDEGIACFRKVIELDPKHAGAHANLAWHLATAADSKLRDPQSAVIHARTATDLQPTNAQHWSNLGVALLRGEEYQAAVESLEKADQMSSGGDLDHRFFLAMAYWQFGEQEKARLAFEQGTQWLDKERPDNDEQRRFRAEAAELLVITQPVVTTPR
jgi:serine/threonine-protein kinase